jgi:hypothetical protein
VFALEVVLNRRQPLTLLLFDAAGQMHWQEKLPDALHYTRTFDVRHLASGAYFLRAITETDAREVRIIMQK